MGVHGPRPRAEPPGPGPRRRSTTSVDVAPDDGDVLARLLPASGLPMLARVDPYGDVVLSGSEMEQLLDELHILMDRSSPPDAVVLGAVVVLAERCRRELGSELRFEGD